MTILRAKPYMAEPPITEIDHVKVRVLGTLESSSDGSGRWLRVQLIDQNGKAVQEGWMPEIETPTL